VILWLTAKFMRTSVYKVPMKAPDDVSAVLSLIKKRKIHPLDIVAILCKTEGNGNVNDFSRALATQSFETMLTQLTNQPRHIIRSQVALVMSGGCEGVMSPHATIFTRNRLDSRSKLWNKNDKRLAIGVAFTRDFKPEEIGRVIQVKEVSNAVRKAMADARIGNTQDVHFVQIKCPLLTSDQIVEANLRGKEVVTADTLKSMAYSRGASALGVATALKEIEHSEVRDEIICKDWRYFSNVASSSAGIEMKKCEIILMGNSYYSDSELVIGHSVMKDAIDSKAVFDALENVNIGHDWPISSEEQQRIVNIFAKAEASPDGTTRGRRHTMLTDSDISSTRHARAVVSAVIASIIGDPMIYVSGGSEHQGPAGGSPIAVIARNNRT
jgi:cyanuric acid amidohydrolase